MVTCYIINGYILKHGDLSQRFKIDQVIDKKNNNKKCDD